jgi:hypothetical protein
MSDEVTIEQFIAAIQKLPEDEPHGSSSVWYRTQKEHWLGWLSAYHGPGAYGRTAGKKRDAKFAYNHIVNPQMLTYLIQAAGVDPRLLQAAKEAAAAAEAEGKPMMSQSASIRRHVPVGHRRRRAVGVGRTAAEARVYRLAKPSHRAWLN